MRILYLPLDSRPCNFLWPLRFIKRTGHEIIVPKKEEMDCYQKPSEYGAIRDYLLSNAPYVDALAISTDQLCYGSLISSRKPDVKPDEAIIRLQTLAEIKKLNPKIKIHAFSVIMRSTISALCKGDLFAYESLKMYSLYSGKAENSRERGCAKAADKYLKAAEKYKSLVGRDTVEAYHFVRNRNHEINMRCVNLLSEGALDSLLLLQEDADRYGFHTWEQKELNASIASLGLKDRAFLHNGADEGGMMCVMKCAQAAAPRLVVYFSYRNGGFTALYEDRPFNENVFDSMRYLGVNANHAAKAALVVHCPFDGKQSEAAYQASKEDKPAHTVDLITKLLSAGKRVYLLDAAYANGGSLRLADELASRGLINRLASYAAWNTASNSLGTVLGCFYADEQSKTTDEEFKLERFLDDVLYQSNIRQLISAKLSEESEDSYNLNNKENAESLLRKEMAKAIDDYSHTLSEKKIPNPLNGFKWQACLPWNRLFEADIHVTKS